MKQQALLLFACVATMLATPAVAHSTETIPMEEHKTTAFIRPSTPSNTAEELFDKGMSAYLSRDYAKALGYFRQAASMGHLEAQQQIGSMYQFGEGVRKNYAEALKWYYAPATQGDVLAQYLIGSLYYAGGWGIVQNYSEALKWFTQASVKGYAAAQSNLGLMYEKGYGTAPDYEKALTYYRKAAVQGDAAAKHNLAEFEKKYTPKNGLKGEAGLAAEDAYQKGHDANIRKDYVQALPLLTKAASMGHANAQFDLATLYDFGEGVPQNYAEAIKWYRKAAEQGNASAQGNIGVLYENGQGVSQNYDEAIKWYRMAMENGNPFAQGNIARVEQKKVAAQRNIDVASASQNGRKYPSSLMEANVKEILADMEKAIDCFGDGNYVEAVRIALPWAKLGNADAQYLVGMCYYIGNDNFPQDYEKAASWLREAAIRESASAQYQLGILFTYGHGVVQDEKEAVKWFRKAAEMEDDDAQFALGACYYTGAGVAKNYMEALKWFRKAAAQGNKKAISMLEEIE